MSPHPTKRMGGGDTPHPGRGGAPAPQGVRQQNYVSSRCVSEEGAAAAYTTNTGSASVAMRFSSANPRLKKLNSVVSA